LPYCTTLSVFEALEPTAAEEKRRGKAAEKMRRRSMGGRGKGQVFSPLMGQRLCFPDRGRGGGGGGA
jgi:hypothetical protein